MRLAYPHDAGVRLALRVPRLLTLLALSLVHCSCSQAPHARSASWLTARAWAGAEPLAPRRAWAVVEFAAGQVGHRYCWGGTGPGCFDCSGLVQRAWASVGVHIPRTANTMASELNEVPLEDVRAGDVLWWPGHVGIYAGNGWMVDALDTPHGVVRRPATDPRRAFRPADSGI